jgi:hypothetical protein
MREAMQLEKEREALEEKKKKLEEKKRRLEEERRYELAREKEQEILQQDEERIASIVNLSSPKRASERRSQTWQGNEKNDAEDLSHGEYITRWL